MTITQLRRRILPFHRAEDGSALTEFTIFLPIWIMMLVAVTSLARVGIFSTKVQLQAQKELWSKAVPLTDTNAYFDSVHANPNTGYGHAVAEYARVAGLDGNPQAVNDGAEVLSSTASLVERHYLESYDRSILPPTQPFIDGVDVSSSPEDILEMNDTDRYPHKLLNDTVTDTSFDGGLLSFVASAAQTGGFVHYMAAGIQYGSVFADKEDSTELFGQWGTLDTQFHIDTLVPPRPLTGTEADVVPATWAWIIFKGDEKYEKYLQWGNENWGGTSGDGSEFEYDGATNEDDLRDENQEAEDVAEDCEEARDDAQQAAQDQWEADGNEGSAPPVDFDASSCY